MLCIPCPRTTSQSRCARHPGGSRTDGPCVPCQASWSETTIVMWVIGLWMGNARPWARGWKRLIVGPSLAIASTITRSSADRLWLFSALAVALLSTRATSTAAFCGMKRSNAVASSTRLPLMAAVTRRVLRVEARWYLAVADTRIGGLLQRRRPLGVLAMPAVVAGGAELTEPVADHVLGHVDRDVLLAVVDGDGVADERREDHRRTRPGLDDLLLVALVHILDPAEEAGLCERALLDGTGHRPLPPTCDAASGRSDVRSSWTAACGSPWRASPTGSWAASRSGTCPRHRRADGRAGS